jgi:HSP20 family protein
MSDPKHIIHIRIRDLRRQKALTQEELAGALGISRQSINAMEAGRCLPSLPVALQIASYFAVPLTYVFEANEEVQRAMQAASQALEAEWVSSPAVESSREVGSPPVNIWHTHTHVFAEVYVPGFPKESLSIEMGDDFLTIAGHELLQDGRSFFLREISLPSFERTVPLPSLVQKDEADAQFRHGVLTISIPKLHNDLPKSAKVHIRSVE